MIGLRAPLARLLGLTCMTLLAACASRSPDGGDRGKVCTEMGCMNGLHVNLSKVTPWTAGNYSFAFELDGAAVTCTGALPLPACDQGPAMRCDVENKVQIGESGCALPAESQSFADIRIEGAPAKVKLTIKREDQPLHTGELTPTYTTSRPNGPGCEPECHGASAEMALP